MKRLFFASALLLLFAVHFQAHAQKHIVINEPAVVNIRHNRATVEWTTSVKTNGKIQFGRTPRTKRFVPYTKRTFGHTITLRRLRPRTRYLFKITAKDKKGQVAVSQLYSFKTDRKMDFNDTTLKITSMPQVTPLSPYKVIISWETNKPSSSIITYGFNKKSKPKVFYSEVETKAHIITLNSLTPNTTYFYQARSRDTSGNLATSSYGSFSTKKIKKSKARPTIRSGPSVIVRKGSSVKIEWETDRPCKSYIKWGDIPLVKHQKKKQVSRRFSSTHLVEMKGLKRGKRYYYTVYLEDQQGRKNSSEIFTIKTDKFD